LWPASRSSAACSRPVASRRNEAIVWSISWLALALAVAAAIGVAGGPVGEWTTVYLIERSLSLDNIFLFTLLLAYFAVPAELRGPMVTIGIAGALALGGCHCRRGGADHNGRGRGLRLRRTTPLRRVPSRSRRRRRGRPREQSAFAVTRDPAVIWTSNAFALLGIGALLALVDILVRRFRYLGKTIAVVLAFVTAQDPGRRRRPHPTSATSPRSP
jgi:tellurite resistance protein TerC